MATMPRHRLLRLMDLNMWEMVREIARNGRDTEIFEMPNLTMVWHPDGAFFNNVVLTRPGLSGTSRPNASRTSSSGSTPSACRIDAVRSPGV